MTKKLGDFTLNELLKICEKQNKDCNHCPLCMKQGVWECFVYQLYFDEDIYGDKHHKYTRMTLNTEIEDNNETKN